MDPLIGIGIVSAGYLALKKSDAAPKLPADSDKPPNGLALYDAAKHGVKLTSVMSPDGQFIIGGTPPPKVKTEAINVGAVLSIITGVVGLVVAVGTAAGVTTASLTAGAAAAGPIAIAVAVIVAFICFNIFIAYNEIDDLSKGRKYYLGNLRQLVNAVKEGVGKVIVGVSDENKEMIARCFAYACARGYNRSQIAFILPRYRSTLNTVDNWNHINYWADRARCIPEIDNISNRTDVLVIGADGKTYGQTEGTIETELFPESSYANEVDKLVKKGLMKTPGTVGSEEDAADFLGRALGCTTVAAHAWSSGGMWGNDIAFITDPNRNVNSFIETGMIGTVGPGTGLPGDYLRGDFFFGIPNPRNVYLTTTPRVSTSGEDGAFTFPYLPTIQNIEEGSVNDENGGKSGLKWFYQETSNNGWKTVLRFNEGKST